MRRYCDTTFNNLQKDLLRCKKTTACFDREVECCFGMAYLYWNKVKEKLTTYEFKSDESEIEFFQHLKPKFTAEIEYYELLYHAVVFEPPRFEDAVLFWNRESARLQKFEAEHKSFLLCYADHRCTLLSYYFLRRHSINGAQRIKLYDAGTKHLTNGDPLVAAFLALQRYMKYVHK
jgi:hypothetical protein